MLRFPDSGNFNGTAYITFGSQEAYEGALACNGEMLEGRALRVRVRVRGRGGCGSKVGKGAKGAGREGEGSGLWGQRDPMRKARHTGSCVHAV